MSVTEFMQIMLGRGSLCTVLEELFYKHGATFLSVCAWMRVPSA